MWGKIQDLVAILDAIRLPWTPFDNVAKQKKMTNRTMKLFRKYISVLYFFWFEAYKTQLNTIEGQRWCTCVYSSFFSNGSPK